VPVEVREEEGKKEKKISIIFEFSGDPLDSHSGVPWNSPSPEESPDHYTSIRRDICLLQNAINKSPHSIL
jgi:hypothetical protein